MTQAHVREPAPLHRCARRSSPSTRRSFAGWLTPFAPLALVAVQASPAFAVPTAANAQSQVVYFEDAAVVTPPQTAFPLYTPGAGSSQSTVRIQLFCPATFAGLPQQPGFVRTVGLQVAGQAAYSTFVVRAGATWATFLGLDFAQNLPDQRVQYDLSGGLLAGGTANGQPANQWVELPLEHPFHWQPGQGLVVDLITHLAVPGSYCGTAIGSGISRAYNFAWTPGANASVTQSTGGLKLMFVFEPLAVLPYGSGCAGSGGFVPRIGSTGTSQLGSWDYSLTLDGALGGAPVWFLLGWSRRSFAGGPLPFDFGGCSLWSSGDYAVAAVLGGAGPGQGVGQFPLAIPAQPWLGGTVVFAQWGVFDPLAVSPLGIAASSGGAVVLFP